MMTYQGPERRIEELEKKVRSHKTELSKAGAGLVLILGGVGLFFYGPDNVAFGHSLLTGLILFGALLIDARLATQALSTLRRVLPEEPKPPEILPPDEWEWDDDDEDPDAA